MSIHLTLDIYIYLLSNARSLCGKQRSKQLYLLCTSKYWRISYINQQRSFHISRTRYKWTRSHTFVCSKHSCNPCNHDLHIGVSKLSTSAPKGLTKVSIHMSRIKNTLDSVSKAVFGNQNEMFSRFSRFKPGILRKKSEDDVLKQKSVKQASGTNTLNDSSGNKTEKCPFPEGEISDPSLESPAKIDPVLEKGLEERKQNIYYTNYIIAKFEESLYFLSSHINSYFTNMTERTENNHLQQGTEMKMGKDEAEVRESPSKDEVQLKEKGTDSQFLSPTVAHSEELTGTSDTLPGSVKQSFANFLARPSGSVQALVGGYIVGLVPKLKADAKFHSEEFQGGKAEQASGKENQEEEKKRLSLQREKIIERVSIDNRTRALVRALRRTTDHKLCINRVEELTFHLLAFPEARALAIKEKLVPYLLRLRRSKDEILQATVRENLALIGYTDPVKGRGIRVLTIDGGGIRGVVALQSLRKIVELTKKPIHQLFDYICGVSTGAILAFMVGLFHMDLDDCEELYRKLGTDVFTQNLIIGTVKMGWKHEFYDSETWERILKDRMGSNLMIETARNPKCPKVSAVSTIVNRGIQPKAFVFRNYGLFPGCKSHYLGGCHHKVWQAIRASSAAPGYFAEYTLGKDLHQDGGLLLNNPTALAMHECKCLWPDTPLQCIVSLGTGRYEGDVRSYSSMTATSLRSKLSTVISSATDTEEVHIMLDDFLPPDIYFRINPVMRENIPLDESRNEKLDFLQSESIQYLERNEEKLKKLAKILTQEKTALQKMNDWLKLKSDMYEGFPFLSKL